MNPLPRCAVLCLIGVAAWVDTSLSAAEPALAVPVGASTITVAPAAAALSVPAASRPKSGFVAAGGEALFLNEYVDVRTATGVVGLAPGTPVRLLRTNGKTGRLIVTDEHLQAEVAPAQVTRDAAVAAGLRRQEEANQRAMQAARNASQIAQAKAQQQFRDARRRYENVLYQEELERELGGMRAYQPARLTFSRVYDRPYGLRGDPYTLDHRDVPRLDKNAPKPKNPLDEGRNYLGFY